MTVGEKVPWPWQTTAHLCKHWTGWPDRQMAHMRKWKYTAQENEDSKPEQNTHSLLSTLWGSKAQPGLSTPGIHEGLGQQMAEDSRDISPRWCIPFPAVLWGLAVPHGQSDTLSDEMCCAHDCQGPSMRNGIQKAAKELLKKQMLFFHHSGPLYKLPSLSPSRNSLRTH